MGFLSKKKDTKKNENKIALVFDIGSSSVGGAIFKVQDSGMPQILHTQREPIKLEKRLDPEKLLTSMAKALESLAHKMWRTGVGEHAKIFCVLSSSWYASQTRVIRFHKNTPFTFTSKFAESLIDREIALFEKENIEIFTGHESEVRLVEWKNIKTLLNGYEAHSPVGKKAKNIEMTIFFAMALSSVLRKIEESISKSFHFRNLDFVSFAMPSFVVARDIFAHKENFILMDITGELTDVSVVKKNALANSMSFPLGANFFTRGMSEALGVSLEEGRSMFYLFKDGHADTKTDKKLSPMVNKLSKEWVKRFGESLVNLSEGISVPSDVFITVDADLQSFFSTLIKDESYSQHALAQAKFKVTFLDSRTLHGAASFRSETVRDPFLVAECVYLNRFV